MCNSGIFFYRKKYKQYQYGNFFKSIRNSKKGKRCFIIGNGPSLRVSDLDCLVSEDCFASNGIYNLYPQTVWRPQYYMIGDRYIKISPETLNSLEAGIVFLGDYFCRFNTVQREDAICLHQHRFWGENRMRFSEDISKYVCDSYTVNFMLAQIAVYMGYTELYFLGCDHNYSLELTPNKTVVKTTASKSHFYEDGASGEIIANVRGMTFDYEVIRTYAEKHGIIVKNATRGGKLEVFERVNFDELIGGVR